MKMLGRSRPQGGKRARSVGFLKPVSQCAAGEEVVGVSNDTR